MNNIAVIYKSKYGTTQKYAEWIAEALGTTAINADDIKPAQLKQYDLVIFGGGLYVGHIAGISLVIKKKLKNLVVFTVGLTNPATTNYSAALAKSLPKEIRESAKFFHLHGTFDFEKLGFMHRSVMGALKKALAKKDETKMTDDERTMSAALAKSVDHTDKNAIKPIVDYVKGMQS